MAVNGILGRKVGMTQLFDDKGDVHPVTVLQAGPCVVTQRAPIGSLELSPQKNGMDTGPPAAFPPRSTS